MSIGVFFSGQGAQTVGMGKSLFDQFDTARNLYSRADEVLGWKLTEASFEGPDTLLTETRVCQPALFVHGFAVYSVLSELGKLDGVTASSGLSLGELTALTSAGVMDFELGLQMVAKRGELMQEACEATHGSMASVIGGTPDQVEALCKEFDVEMANLNCPGQIVISGEKGKIVAAVKKGETMDFRMVKELNVAGAYHSRLMQPAATAYADYLKTLELEAPRFAVYSNTTGETVRDAQEIKDALVKQIVSPVRFEDCVRNAVAGQNLSYLVECGVGRVIVGLTRRMNREWKAVSVSEASDIPESL